MLSFKDKAEANKDEPVDHTVVGDIFLWDS